MGLWGPGEAVRINFGQRPFLFDLGASVKGEDYREQAAVAAVPVCPSLLRSLVRDYLLHQVCVCVCMCVCVFFICIVRTYWLTNEDTSACSGEKTHKRILKCRDPFDTGCVCMCV